MYLLFIFCALILFSLFAWVTIRRSNKRWLLLRLVVGAVAVGALYWIAFPPHRTVKVNPGEAILLTEGYHEDSLEALIEKLTPAQPLLLSYGVAVEETERVVNMTQLQQIYPQAKKLHVLGNGLEADALEELQGITVVPHLGPKPTGLTFVHWPKKITLGEPVIISGKFNQLPKETSSSLGLKVAGEVVDSVLIEDEGEQSFQLSFTPKATGRFVYVLQVKTNKEVRNEELAIEVAAPQPLQVLMLAAYPTPEMRFLKTALAGQQHGVAFRATISKEKYYGEWLNRERLEVERLSPAVLAPFDLVIADGATLQALHAAERIALQEAISKEGLGLLLIADELPLKNSPLYQDFHFTRVSRTATHTTRLTWQGMEQTTPEVEALPFAILAQPAVFPLVSDEAAAWFAAGKRSGWGHIAVSALPNTFQWALSGREELYKQYWAHLLNRLARKKAVAWQGYITSGIPMADQAVELRLADYTGSSLSLQASVVQEGTAQAAALPLAQDPRVAYHYDATYWPKQNGWHQLIAAEDTVYFYVSEKNAWKSIQQMEKQRATLRYAATAKENDNSSTETIALAKPLNPLYFYLIFIAAIGFLWLEEKL